MNWYKYSQQNIQQQYQEALESNASINVIGTGYNSSINIRGNNVSVKEIIDQALAVIAPILQDNGIHTVDTNPLTANPSAQGLAVSSEPGTIHIDVNKILNNAQSSLPPTANLDGTYLDNDIINELIENVKQYLLSEIGETAAHESQHMADYAEISQTPINNVIDFHRAKEQTAEQFGKKIKQQYF